MRISIRPAVATDEEFVNALTRTVMRPYVEATWQSDTEREDYYRLNRFQQDGTAIIQVDGIDTGRMTITREAGRIALDEIHLLPEYQGRGIGQILIRQVLNEADGLGVPTEIKVLKKNPAQGLYQRLGFVVVREADDRLYMTRDVQRIKSEPTAGVAASLEVPIY